MKLVVEGNLLIDEDQKIQLYHVVDSYGYNIKMSLVDYILESLESFEVNNQTIGRVKITIESTN